MKRSKVIIVLGMLLILVGTCFAEIDVDISGSAVQVVNYNTIHIQHVTSPQYPGDVFWADLTWDPTNLVLAPVNIGVESAPPPAENTMTWHVTDLCNDGYAVDYRFFSEDRSWVWPGTSTYWYTQAYNVTYTNILSCNSGEKICIGGQTGSWYWGVGLDGSHSCTNCCGVCDGQTYTYNFGC